MRLFEERRRFLTGLAYRMLGSVADAEDAVQETCVRWLRADRAAIGNPAAWLTTVCTRHCLDLLQSAQRARVDYIGIWLPEPVQTAEAATPEDAAELASSLSMAFLLVLERLSPKERAAYLLHEVFDQSHADVAATLGVTEAACRKLVSRARAGVGHRGKRNTVSLERQDALLSAFRQAVETGDTTRLAARLSEDIELRADGGGKVPANPEPLVGRIDVLDFISGKLGIFWKNYAWRPISLNGFRGALLCENGRIAASVSFSCDVEGRLSGIFITRNPEKLSRFEGGAI
ncbi:RNA polymerase sigma factor SigJ [Paenirhodobacter sp.]|uniref:RNA polymerase sigma factor SigJ n=1 Tax=Paenirhodobacter sp. TaxID=1965326 RepID=UPI003B41E1B1